MKNLFIILFTFFLFSCSVEEIGLENSVPDKITITNLHQSLGIDISVENGRIAASEQLHIYVIREVNGNSSQYEKISPIPNTLNIDFSTWLTGGDVFSSNAVDLLTNIDLGASGSITHGELRDITFTSDVYASTIQLQIVHDTYPVTMDVITSKLLLSKLHQDLSVFVDVPNLIEINIYGCFNDNYDGGSNLVQNCVTRNISTHQFSIDNIDNSINQELYFPTANIDEIEVKYLRDTDLLFTTNLLYDPVLNVLAQQRLNITLPNHE